MAVTQILKHLDPIKLRPHPISQQIYQDSPSDELRASVRESGVISPLVVAADERTVVSGRRRRSAAIEAASKTVPCIVRLDLTDDLDIRQAVLEANVHNEKTTEQRAREYAERQSILQKLAERRKKAGVSAGEAKGRTKEVAAEAVGMSVPTADKALAVIAKADQLVKDGKSEEAEAIIETLNEESVAAAARLVGDRFDGGDSGDGDSEAAHNGAGKKDVAAKRAGKPAGKAARDDKAVAKSREALASLVRALPKPVYAQVKQYLEIISQKLDAY